MDSNASTALPILSSLHISILKVLGEKPLEHTEASYVRARMLAKGFGLYDICKAMCSLEEWGQLVMCGLEDSDPEAKMTLLLTPSGRITATGAALGITSVVLPVAKEVVPQVGRRDLGILMQAENLTDNALASGETGSDTTGAGEGAKYAPAGSGDREIHVLPSRQPLVKHGRDLCQTCHEPSETLYAVEGYKVCGDCRDNWTSHTDSQTTRELVPEEEKWSDFQTSREMYSGIRLVK